MHFYLVGIFIFIIFISIYVFFCMKLLLFPAIALILLFSCSSHGEVEKMLNEISSYVGQRPYDALMALQEIPRETLSGKEVNAEYSLLHAIAMEGSFIPVTDLSIIQPSIDFYLQKGTPSQKLRTLYYQGRICMENGDTEGAMECFVKGLVEGSNSGDRLFLARTLYAKGEIHAIFRDYGKYMEAMLSAAESFREEGEHISYFSSLSNAFSGCLELDDQLRAGEILEEMVSVADTSNINQFSLLHESGMRYEARYGEKGSVADAVLKYRNNVPPTYVNWLSVAEVSLMGGDIEGALEAIEQFGVYTAHKGERFYAVASKVYEELGHKEKALEYYRNYVKMSDSSEIALLGNDARFIEERFNLQMQAMEREMEKRRLLLYGLFFIMLLVGVIAYVVYRLKLRKLENETYRLQCSQLEQEKSALATTLEESWVVSAPVGEIIRERLALLNTVMAANISENDKIDRNAQSGIDMLLSDRKSFMNSTVSAFEASHPAFISHLKGCSLTEVELGYCCLYAIGLNGKNVGEYTKMSRHYIINSEIRKKLGLEEKSMNLDKYIQTFLK